MENDHDVCKAALDAAAKRIEELERENAELEQDRERLDWLEANYIGYNFRYSVGPDEFVSVLVVQIPKGTTVSANFRETVDRGIA